MSNRLFTMKYIILLITILNSQVPRQFSFDNNSLYRYESISEENISDNSIIDIRKIDDEYILLSTGKGLSYVKKINNFSTDSVIFGQFNRNLVSLPKGGIPALITNENIIAISGLVDTIVASLEERKGTGISTFLRHSLLNSIFKSIFEYQHMGWYKEWPLK